MFATSTPRILKAVFFVASGFVLGAGIMFWSADRGDALEEVNTLLVTSETILGQPFSYPTKKPAKVTAAIVTMPPGGTTGWHEHPVPLFGTCWKVKLPSTTDRMESESIARATP
ncbi:MAG: hypothetical protein GY877_03270 [Hyphomicrobium sp.]|nr:hypothetical protein [Hyphomicrobium sp.]